ncbi:hypothetical protein RQP46_004623 [Phenoliferia psychrophenolica]
MSSGGAAADTAIYAVGPAFAEEDKVLAEKKAAQVAIRDGEKVFAVGEEDLHHTEDHFDPEFPDDVYPTDEQKATLRRKADVFPIRAYAIGFVELAERFSYYGTTIVFTNFIQQPLPAGSKSGAGGANGQSGALGMGQEASNGLTTFLSFWVYLCPLVGGWIADAKWGRYKTIQRGIWCSIFAHILILIAGIPKVIATKGASVAMLILGIIILGFGTGAFKPNISPLVAEQYRRKLLRVETLKSGEQVIIDPALTASRIYMYFYLLINVYVSLCASTFHVFTPSTLSSGAIAGQVGMVYCEKYVGFWLSFLLPTCVFLICPFIMFFGKKHYVLLPPTGSALGKSLSTLRMCLKGRWSLNPVTFYKNLKAPDFYDAARVAIYFPIYWLPYNQISNNLTSQSAVLNTHGTPNDLINNIDPIAIIILIPLCDLIFYPMLRRLGISVSPIRKIFWGFMTAAIAMMGAAIIQHYIYKNSPCRYSAATCDGVADINVWIQTPVYFFIALSEVLASITSLEYAYTKAPKSMRGMIQAVFLLTTAIANAITEAFVPLATDPLVVWNYGVMGVLAFIGGVAFFFTFRNLDRAEDSLNAMGDPKGRKTGKDAKKQTGHLPTDSEDGGVRDTPSSTQSTRRGKGRSKKASEVVDVSQPDVASHSPDFDGDAGDAGVTEEGGDDEPDGIERGEQALEEELEPTADFVGSSIKKSTVAAPPPPTLPAHDSVIQGPAVGTESTVAVLITSELEGPDATVQSSNVTNFQLRLKVIEYEDGAPVFSRSEVLRKLHSRNPHTLRLDLYEGTPSLWNPIPSPRKSQIANRFVSAPTEQWWEVPQLEHEEDWVLGSLTATGKVELRFVLRGPRKIPVLPAPRHGVTFAPFAESREIPARLDRPAPQPRAVPDATIARSTSSTSARDFFSHHQKSTSEDEDDDDTSSNGSATVKEAPIPSRNRSRDDARRTGASARGALRAKDYFLGVNLDAPSAPSADRDQLDAIVEEKALGRGFPIAVKRVSTVADWIKTWERIREISDDLGSRVVIDDRNINFSAGDVARVLGWDQAAYSGLFSAYASDPLLRRVIESGGATPTKVGDLVTLLRQISRGELVTVKGFDTAPSGSRSRRDRDRSASQSPDDDDREASRHRKERKLSRDRSESPRSSRHDGKKRMKKDKFKKREGGDRSSSLPSTSSFLFAIIFIHLIAQLPIVSAATSPRLRDVIALLPASFTTLELFLLVALVLQNSALETYSLIDEIAKGIEDDLPQARLSSLVGPTVLATEVPQCLHCEGRGYLQKLKSPSPIILLDVEGPREASVVQCECSHCGAVFWPDRYHVRVGDESIYVYDWNAKYIRLGAKYWASRRLANNLLLQHYHHTSFTAANQIYHESYDPDGLSKATPTHLFTLYVFHIILLHSERSKVPFLSRPAWTINDVVKAADLSLFASGRRIVAHHDCTRCCHVAVDEGAVPAPGGAQDVVERGGDGVDVQQPDGEAKYVNMWVMDGVTLGPISCAEPRCPNSPANYRSVTGRWCDAHQAEYFGPEAYDVPCGVIGCDNRMIRKCVVPNPLIDGDDPARGVSDVDLLTDRYPHCDDHLDDLGLFLDRYGKGSNYHAVQRWRRDRRNDARDPDVARDAPAWKQKQSDDVAKIPPNTWHAGRWKNTSIVVRPCGVPVSMMRMHDSEADSESVRLLEETFAAIDPSKPPEDNRPSLIAFDRWCKVLAHLITSGKWFDDGWDKTTRGIVDGFHYLGHKSTDQLCVHVLEMEEVADRSHPHTS